MFNQGARQDTSSYENHIQAHAELYTAHYTTPTATLPATDDLQAYAKGMADGGTVPLSVMLYDFNHLNPDALTQNLIRLTGETHAAGTLCGRGRPGGRNIFRKERL